MKRVSVIQLICFGGIFTAITVILQAAPVYLPAIGLALSPGSTLPVALATIINVNLGIMVYISSVFILFMISIEEAMICLFATGLIGLTLAALLYRRSFFISIFTSSATLAVGMMILTYIVAIPGFSEFTATLSLVVTTLIYFIFSLFYISIWAIILRRFTHRFPCDIFKS